MHILLKAQNSGFTKTENKKWPNKPSKKLSQYLVQGCVNGPSMLRSMIGPDIDATLGQFHFQDTHLAFFISFALQQEDYF